MIQRGGLMSTSRPARGRSAFVRIATGTSTVLSLPLVVLALQASPASASASPSAPSPSNATATGVSPLAGAAQSELLGLPLGTAIWLLVGLIAVIAGLWSATRRPAQSPNVETAVDRPGIRPFSVRQLQTRIRSAAGAAPGSPGAVVSMDDPGTLPTREWPPRPGLQQA